MSAGGAQSSDDLVIRATVVIFDNDGVLVASSASVDRAWSAWAHRRGIDPASVLAVAHSRPARETVAMFVAEPERVAARAEIDLLELQDADGVRAVAGAGALIAQLEHGRWAVVTSGTRALATARLTAAGLTIPPVLVTADDVRRGKPDPEGYDRAIRQLGVDAAQAVVLEDSPSGILAARGAGVQSIVGVGPGAFGAGAMVVIDDLRAAGWHDGLVIRAEGRIA